MNLLINVDVEICLPFASLVSNVLPFAYYIRQNAMHRFIALRKCSSVSKITKTMSQYDRSHRTLYMSNCDQTSSFMKRSSVTEHTIENSN